METEQINIGDLAGELHKKIMAEIGTRLQGQLERLGESVSPEAAIDLCVKQFFPEDDKRLAEYFFKDQFLLRVSIQENWMGIEFAMPHIAETH